MQFISDYVFVVIIYLFIKLIYIITMIDKLFAAPCNFNCILCNLSNFV